MLTFALLPYKIASAKVMKREDYFSRIPNEIMEALAKTNLSAYESKYIFSLLRKTFGFHKGFDYISNSQFAMATGIKRPHVCRTELKLLSRKIITCRGNKIGINRSFDQWKELPDGVIVTRRGKTMTWRGNKKLPGEGATKESKKSIQKKDFSSLKRGNPYYNGHEMRFAHNQWWVIEKGEWLKYADKESKIEWR